MRTWLLVLLLALMLMSTLACNRRRGGGGGGDDDDLGADGDADADSDADSDADADADSDADVDGDADVDSDADVDGDADVDSDADSDADGDLDPCGWGNIPADYEGPVEGSYSFGGGAPSAVTGTITLGLTPRVADYAVAVTIQAADAGGFAFLGDGTGDLDCSGDVAGTFTGDGGGLTIEGTFSGFFDDADWAFDEGEWDLADTLGFGIVGNGTWSATEAP